MEEAYNIFNYLPISYKSESEEKYVAFLWDSFRVNYEAEKFPFAFIAFNMLYMSFVYFEVWQIKQNKRKEFEMAMVGFDNQRERGLINSTSPFAFWSINERSFFRFLKIINCSNDRIGSFAKIVDSRNDAAHSNGNIYFNSQKSIDDKIREVMRHIEEIQILSHTIIEESLVEFLKNSWNPKKREYFDDVEQIQEALVHKNYLSLKDIELMKEFDISSLASKRGFKSHFIEIKGLFDLFSDLYRGED